MPDVAKPGRQAESMWIRRNLVLCGLVKLAALHSKRAVAIIELIDEIFGSIGNTNRTDDFVSLNNHTARSIALATRRRHVEDSLRDAQLVTAWLEKISDSVVSLS